jgi:D-sedoheptulose 7-phosphate isomerase
MTATAYRARADVFGGKAASLEPVDYFERVSENFRLLCGQADQISGIFDLVAQSLRQGGKVMFCGNGGSAADSQHLAAELIGRFRRERPPFAALALTVDTSAITAIANDYQYDEVFARQVEGLGKRGDVLFALSTSGNSRNVLQALEAAKRLGIHRVGLTGANGGRMASLCDICVCAPSTETCHIQEMHIAIGHIVCRLLDGLATS